MKLVVYGCIFIISFSLSKIYFIELKMKDFENINDETQHLEQVVCVKSDVVDESPSLTQSNENINVDNIDKGNLAGGGEPILQDCHTVENVEKEDNGIMKESGNIKTEDNDIIDIKENENIEKDNNLKENKKDNNLKENDKDYLHNNEKIKLADEIINDKIEEALKKQNPKNRRKSIIISLVFLFINLFFMFFIVKNLFSEIDGDVFYVFKAQGNKLWWLLVGFIAYAIFIFIQVCEYKLLISNLSGLDNKRAWKVSYDVTLIGRYYDNLTPLSVGGEPMQIVALSKEKVSPAVATGIPVIKMLVNTIISAVLAMLFFIFGLPYIKEITALNQLLLFLLEILGVIGVIITFCSALFMFMLSTGTLFTRSFISGILRFLYKIKIVKNYRSTYKKVLNQVAEYKFSMKYLMSHKKVFFKLFFMCLLDNVVYSLFPCFVILAFVDKLAISPIYFVLICMIKYHLSTMASCFIPLPGGTGLMEISFIILFGSEVGQNIVWALLAWRFLSYYLILIHGFIHELVKIWKNISNNKKQQISDCDSDSDNDNNNGVIDNTDNKENTDSTSNIDNIVTNIVTNTDTNTLIDTDSNITNDDKSNSDDSSNVDSASTDFIGVDNELKSKIED